jgi:TatA/E family protein of Tat protein translocase
MPNIGAPELIIILVIALLILGPGKLPEVGASLGKSIKEFRKASTDLQDSVKVDVDTSPLPAAAPAAAPVAAAVQVAAPAPAPVGQAAPPTPAAPAPAAPVAPASSIDVPAGGLGSGPATPPAASDSTTVAS